MDSSGEESVNEGLDETDASTKPVSGVALVSRLVRQMDVDNPDNLKTVTLRMLNDISAPDEEWKTLWETTAFARFLDHCVDVKVCCLNLDKFLRAHASLRDLVHPDVLQKIAAEVLESEQPAKPADRFWENDEIPERYRRHVDMFRFALKGQRIAEVKRAMEIALGHHARQAMDRASAMGIEKCLKEKLSEAPCGQCDYCVDIAYLQSPLKKLSDWNEIKDSIDQFREEAKQSIVRKDTQEHSSSVERQHVRLEFDRTLLQEIKTRIGPCHADQYTDQEKQEIQEGLFRQLDVMALQKDAAFSLKDQFSNDMGVVYADGSEVMVNFVQQNLSLDEILDISTDASVKMKLSRLKDSLRKHLRKLLELRKTEGYHSHILVELKKAVSSSLAEFSFKTQNLSADVRNRVHAWAQQQLPQRLEKVQKEWNQQHGASAVLATRKRYYTHVADIVLTDGFAHRVLAEVMAHCMLSHVNMSATKAEVSKRVLSILSLPWIATGESIRIKYFVELALEVESGNKTRALSHFRHPKLEVEAWFAGAVEKEYAKPAQIFAAEFDRQVQSRVKKISESSEFSQFVALTAFDKSIASEWFRSADLGPAGFAGFRENVVAAVGEKRHIYESFDSGSYSPSKNVTFTSRLGCTEACFWCGALCWGERGHDDHRDETRVHFSSHQPTGLHGTRKVRPLNLMADSCHMWKDSSKVNMGDLYGVPWKRAKTEYFADWNFDRHYDDNLDALMRWFLQELHVDLAQSESPPVRQATAGDLKKYECTGLQLDEILRQIEPQ